MSVETFVTSPPAESIAKWVKLPLVICHLFHSVVRGIIDHFIDSDDLQFLNLLILSNQICRLLSKYIYIEEIITGLDDVDT